MTYAWSPGGDFGSPTYTLPIKIVDGMRSTLKDERRTRWTEALALALGWWALDFTVTYRPESQQAFRATDETISTLSVNPLIVVGAIALVHLHSDVAGDSAGWIEEMGGGICLLTPWRGWWGKGDRGAIATVAAHEIGHALGFGHGGDGVMMGAGRPNDQERQLAQDYYA